MLGGRLVVVYDAVVDLSFVLRFFELTVFCRCPLFVFFFTRGGEIHTDKALLFCGALAPYCASRVAALYRLLKYLVPATITINLPTVTSKVFDSFF